MAKKQILLDDEVQKRIVEKSKLSNEERFALDAYIVSNLTMTEKKYLAYSVSRKGKTTENAESLEQLVYRWFRKLGVRYYIEDREIELFGTKRERNEEGNIKADLNVIRSKEETLEELNDLATSTNDAKLKAELLMKIADLQNWKKKEDEDKDSRITYFAPIKCSKCPIKAAVKHDNMTKLNTK